MLSEMGKEISVNRPRLARLLSSRAVAMSRDNLANVCSIRGYNNT